LLININKNVDIKFIAQGAVSGIIFVRYAQDAVSGIILVRYAQR